ncbi:putative transcription factor interactor and regulator CCHC(Zn) family [Arabidopsis thaliana]|jgi:zinc finger SWIM domain-containing protein 3
MGKGKLILICQSGGKFVTDDDGTMTYTGGEAEAIDINHETTFDDFKLKLAKLLNLAYSSLSLKYFLPGNRRTLITMKQEKDMKRMYDFHLSSVTAEVFITGQYGFQSEAVLSPGTRSYNIAIGTETTPVAYGNVANVPIQVITGTPEENNLADINLSSRKVAPRVTSESSGLIDIPVTISTIPVGPAKSTSKKFKTKGKNSLVSNITNLTPKSLKQTFIGSNPGSKSSPPTSLSVVCGVTTSSPRSVSKRRRVMEEPIILLQDENVTDTRRRSLRNRGEIRKPVIETDDDDVDADEVDSDEDDSDDVDADNVEDDDDKDYVQDIETYYPETEDLDYEREINYSISEANDGSVESLVASWKRCITGVGQGFESVVEFRDALQKYAVACRFGYRLRKNESNRACGVCLVGGCPWKIYASWVPSESVFRIKKFNRRHTCGGESWKSAHPKKNWVVGIIKERLQENPNQKTKNIADSFFQDFGIELSYCTIRRGIDEAKGGLHTSFKEAYKYLPHFVNKVVEANPGSMVNLVVGEDRRFQRLFLSFQSCIHGFQTGCRPLLFLDAIPFKSRYHEILLTASALDGDDCVLPVALALVDVETDETWRWFLEQLKVALSSLRPLTFVSDREKGLVTSVLEIFENAHHGYSIHYLMEDFMRSLRGPFLGDGKPSLTYYLLAAARADRLDGFKVYTEQIRRVSPRAYDWVMQIESKHWACALFEGEPYSHITSDVAEIYSKWIEEIQETSIVQKLVAFVNKIVELVNSSQEKSKPWFSQLVPSKEESLVEECKKAGSLKVFFCSDTLFEVHDGSVQLVDISNQTCSCFGWKPTGLPCQHAIAVLNTKGRNLYDYCSSFFTVDSYRLTYSVALGAVAIDLALVENEGSGKEEDEQVLPPLFSRVQGVEKRIKDRKRGRSVCCTKCGGVGHNKATCKDD